MGKILVGGVVGFLAALFLLDTGTDSPVHTDCGCGCGGKCRPLPDDEIQQPCQQIRGLSRPSRL
jgi:hypothetical protein